MVLRKKLKRFLYIRKFKQKNYFININKKNVSLDLYKKYKTIVFAIDPGNVQTNMNPGGQEIS